MTRYETVASTLYRANQGDPHDLWKLLDKLVTEKNYPMSRLIMIGERLFKIPAHAAYDFVEQTVTYHHFC